MGYIITLPILVLRAPPATRCSSHYATQRCGTRHRIMVIARLPARSVVTSDHTMIPLTGRSGVVLFHRQPPALYYVLRYTTVVCNALPLACGCSPVAKLGYPPDSEKANNPPWHDAKGPNPSRMRNWENPSDTLNGTAKSAPRRRHTPSSVLSKSVRLQPIEHVSIKVPKLWSVGPDSNDRETVAPFLATTMSGICATYCIECETQLEAFNCCLSRRNRAACLQFAHCSKLFPDVIHRIDRKVIYRPCDAVGHNISAPNTFSLPLDA